MRSSLRRRLAAIMLATLPLSGCIEPEQLPPPPVVAAWKDGFRVLFVGDVYFGTSYRGLDERIAKNAPDFGFARLRPFLEAADLVIGNLESPIIDSAVSTPIEDSIGYRHWIDVRAIQPGLVAQGFDAVSLANNHAMDQGIDGLTQTLDSLAGSGVRAFGAGLTQQASEQPFETTLPMDTMPLRLAVFGAFEYLDKYDTRHHIYADGEKPGVARLSAERASELVQSYKTANPDSFVVLFPHWGGNYSWKTWSQTRIARAVLRAGADAVIGQGAHTLQEIEQYGEKVTIYNIGNFVFASPGRYDQYEVTPYGMAALLRLRAEQGVVRVDARLYPIATDNRIVGYQPRPLDDEEFAALRTLLAKKSGAPFSRLLPAGKDPLGPFFELPLK